MTTRLRLALPFLTVLLLHCGDPAASGPLDSGVDAGPDAEIIVHDNPARVLRVIDGDTIDVNYLGVEYRIRMLGIDTPELTPSPEPYAVDAKTFTTQHAPPASTVGLEFDNPACGTAPLPSGCLDLYDRLLAYVRTAQNQDLNGLLISNGLARVYEAADCDRKSDYLTQQSQAQLQGIGIWSQ